MRSACRVGADRASSAETPRIAASQPAGASGFVLKDDLAEQAGLFERALDE